MKNYSLFRAAATASLSLLGLLATNKKTDANIQLYTPPTSDISSVITQLQTLNNINDGYQINLNNDTSQFSASHSWTNDGTLIINGLDVDNTTKHTLAFTYLELNSGGTSNRKNLYILNTNLIPIVGTYFVLGSYSTNSVNYNFEGSTFTGFSTSVYGLISVYHPGTNTLTGGEEGVSFVNNKNTEDDGVITLHTTNSNLSLSGKQTFLNNEAFEYGGAISVQFGTLTTTSDSNISFINNSAKTFGGAIDIWGQNADVTFNGITHFEGNRITSSNAFYNSLDRGAHGGAINIGEINGTVNLYFNGTTQFIQNFITNTHYYYGNRGNSVGGAICVLGTSGLAYYHIEINTPTLFQGNYVYSKESHAYGGAIYYNTQPSTTEVRVFKIGAGSEFIENYAGSDSESNGAAKGLGGAIYFVSGTFEIYAESGRDTIFKDNEHHVKFQEENGIYVPIKNSGDANAIVFGHPHSSFASGGYIANSKFNLLPSAGGTIHFYDPIATDTAGGEVTVTLNKSRAGDVIFYTHDSPVQMPVKVQAGYFRLREGAKFGETVNSPLTVSSGGAVTLSEGAVMSSSNATVADGGRILVEHDPNKIYLQTENNASKHPVLRTASLTFASGGGVGGDGILDVKNASGASVSINLGAGGADPNSLFFVTVDSQNGSEDERKNATFSLTTPIVGKGRLVKEGPGKYLLNGSSPQNAYFGGTRIDEGLIEINLSNTSDTTYWNSNKLLSSGGITVNDGTAFSPSILRIQPNSGTTKGNYKINNVLLRTDENYTPAVWVLTNAGQTNENYTKTNDTPIKQQSTGLIEIDLESGAESTSRYNLTISTASQGYNARLLVKNLDFTFAQSASHDVSVNGSLGNTRFELGEGARVVVLAGGASYLGALKFASSTQDGANAAEYPRRAYLKFNDLGNGSSSEAVGTAASWINAYYPTPRPDSAPYSESGIIDFSGYATIVVNGGATGTPAEKLALESLFHDNPMPLLLRDDYGLPRTLIKGNGVNGSPDGHLSLTYPNGTAVEESDYIDYKPNTEVVARQKLILDERGLTTGPNADGLYIGAILRYIEIYPEKTLTLRPETNTEFPDGAPTDPQTIANHEFRTAIIDLTAEGAADGPGGELAKFNPNDTKAPGTVQIDAYDSYVQLSQPVGNLSPEPTEQRYIGTTQIYKGELRVAAPNVLANSRQLKLEGGTTFRAVNPAPEAAPLEVIVNRLVDDDSGTSQVIASENTTIILNNSPWFYYHQTGNNKAGLVGIYFTDENNISQNKTIPTEQFEDFVKSYTGDKNPTQDTTYHGVLTGNGTYQKTGTGTLTLTNPGNFPNSNNLTISDGKIQLAAGGSFSGTYDGQITLDTSNAAANPAFIIAAKNPANLSISGRIYIPDGDGTHPANATIAHYGTGALTLVTPVGTTGGDGASLEKLTLGGGGSPSPSILAGNGSVSEITFGHVNYPGGLAANNDAVRTFFDTTRDVALLSPGTPRRQIEPDPLTPTKYIQTAPGGAGDLTLGTENGTTILHNVILELDLGADDSAGHSDKIYINNQAVIGDLLIDIAHISAGWASGRWEIIRSYKPIEDFSGSPITTTYLKEHAIFTQLTNPPPTNTTISLIPSSNNESIYLHISGTPPSIYWYDDAVNGSHIWTSGKDGVAPETSNQNWLSFKGDNPSVVEHTTSAIAFFEDNVYGKDVAKDVLVATTDHDDGTKGAKAYGMEISGSVKYNFYTEKKEFTININPNSFLADTVLAQEKPESGSYLLVASGSSANFYIPVSTPGGEIRGDVLFDRPLTLGFVKSNLLDTGPGNLTQENVDMLLNHNGILNIEGRADAPASLTIGGNLLINLGELDGPEHNGRAVININQYGSLHFQRNQNQGTQNNYTKKEPSTTAGYFENFDDVSYTITDLHITGTGKIVREAGGTTTFGDNVILGKDTTPHTVPADYPFVDKAFISSSPIHIANTGVLSTQYGTRGDGSSVRLKNFEQILSGKLTSDARPTDGSAPALLHISSTDPNIGYVTLTNEFSSYQGNITVNRAILRIEGRIGVIAEDFDNYAGSLMPARYQHAIFNGDIKIDETGGILEFARNVQTSSAEAAYDSIGAGGIWMSNETLSENNPNGGIWVNNSNYQVLNGKLHGGAGELRQTGNTTIYLNGDAKDFDGKLNIQNGRFNMGQGVKFGEGNVIWNSITIGSPTTDPLNATNRPILSAVGGNIFTVKKFDLHSNGKFIVGAGRKAADGITAIPGAIIDNRGTATDITIAPNSTITLHLGADMISRELSGGTAPYPPRSPALKFDGYATPTLVDTAYTDVAPVNIEVIPSYIPAPGDAEFILIENISISISGKVPGELSGSDLEKILKLSSDIGMGDLYWKKNEAGSGNLYFVMNAAYAYGANTVPEPSTYALCGAIGALALAFYRRRRKTKSN